MAETAEPTARLSIDVSPAERRRIRIAAARRDQSIREYVRAAVNARLDEDLGAEDARDDLITLNERADPVLADLWDNDKDAAYDKL